MAATAAGVFLRLQWSCYRRLDDVPDKRRSWPGPADSRPVDLDRAGGSSVREQAPAFSAGKRLGHLASGEDSIQIPVRPT